MIRICCAHFKKEKETFLEAARLRASLSFKKQDESDRRQFIFRALQNERGVQKIFGESMGRAQVKIGRSCRSLRLRRSRYRQRRFSFSISVEPKRFRSAQGAARAILLASTSLGSAACGRAAASGWYAGERWGIVRPRSSASHLIPAAKLDAPNPTAPLAARSTYKLSPLR